MMAWVSCARVPPPDGERIGVRFGATMFDAYRCKYRKLWFMLVPGGTEEEIAEPPLWYDKTAKVDDRLESLVEPPRIRRRTGQQQLSLTFGQSDSKTLSNRR